MTTSAGPRAARALAIALLGAFAGSGAPIAHAQTTNEGRLSLSMGIDTSNAYFFRGIKQERSGAIVQPYADVSFDLLTESESLSTLTLTFGQWNSLHSGPSGAGGPATLTGGAARNTAMWYESDFYTGLTVGTDTLTAGLTYTSYLSPNNSFGTVQEISLALSLDDTGRLLVPLQPHVGLAVELSGQGGRRSGRGHVPGAGHRAGARAARGRPGLDWLPRHGRPEPQPLLRGRRRAQRCLRVLRPRGRGHVPPGHARFGGHVDDQRRRASAGPR